MIREFITAILIGICFISIHAQSTLPKDWPTLKTDLGIKNVTDVIPLDNTYENKLISSSFLYNDARSGRRYTIDVNENGKRTIYGLKLKTQFTTDILTNSSRVSDLSNITEYDLAPYTDKWNKDGSFMLSQLHYEYDRGMNSFVRLCFLNSQNCLAKYKFDIPSTFEYAKGDNIETFNFGRAKGGNGIFAFTAQSTYTKKHSIFVGEIEEMTTEGAKVKLSKLDLSSVNAVLSKFNYDECTIYSYTKDSYGCNFLILQFGTKVIPIRIRNSYLMASENAALELGTFSENAFDGYSGVITPIYDTYGTQFKGIVNAYTKAQDDNCSYKVKLFDVNLQPVWETEILDMRVMSIIAQGNYLILGGYTKNKGYVGYANPRIVVMNIKDKSITYDKVIPIKAGSVTYITSDFNHNLELVIGSWSDRKHSSSDISCTPKLILDKLTDNGIFENDLFQPKK